MVFPLVGAGCWPLEAITAAFQSFTERVQGIGAVIVVSTKTVHGIVKYLLTTPPRQPAGCRKCVDRFQIHRDG